MRARGLSLVSQPDVRRDPGRTGSLEAVSADAALVQRSRSGDLEAFATLYRTYRDAVYATCLKRLRDRDLAEDAAQDTFLRAHASLDRFDERRPLAPWLSAIATRRCIDLMRRGSRTTATEDVSEYLPDDPESDPTLGSVIASEERGRLERALRQLHPRQRRALLLHALEGWSYADIAEAEGISVSSTKSLLFHARANLKRACRRGVLGTILVAVGALRRRAERGATVVRSRLAGALEPVASALGPVSSGLAAVVISLTATTAPILAVASTSTGLDGSSPVAARAHGGSGRLPSADIAPAAHPADLAGALLDPAKNATPEETQFTSVAPSPSYEQDHTLVAAGRVSCPQTSCPVLFVSRDGGATWKRRAADDFHGHTVLLPPSYPADPRIFAMGPSGLQVSTDGGTSFDVALPIQGDVAISPLFDGADPRLLIGATVVTEYWADSELAKPATLIGPAGTWLTVAFSPAYALDHAVFVGGVRPDTTGTLRPTVNRCVDSVCDSIVFSEGFDAPFLRPSPTLANDGTVYAFTAHTLFRSLDEGRTFAVTSPAFARTANMRDALTMSDGSVLVAVEMPGGAGGGIFRSADGGTSWTKTRVALAGFTRGVTRLILAPDGRLLALGADLGIACSGDAGSTWTRRCGS